MKCSWFLIVVIKVLEMIVTIAAIVPVMLYTGCGDLLWLVVMMGVYVYHQPIGRGCVKCRRRNCRRKVRSSRHINN